MSGARRLRGKVLGLGLGLVGIGCDTFAPPSDAPPVERPEARARALAKEAMRSTLRAAEAATASCVAGELRWEADAGGTFVPHHFSRPCIPELCAPEPAELEALRASARAMRALVERETSLAVPSFQGFAALADAMVSFTDAALAGVAPAAKERAARLSGLSMHHGALALSFHELYPDESVRLEPAALTASLSVAEPGGDPCKGWALPQYCDVRGVRVPKERRWRAAAACIEVEGIPK